MSLPHVIADFAIIDCALSPARDDGRSMAAPAALDDFPAKATAYHKIRKMASNARRRHMRRHQLPDSIPILFSITSRNYATLRERCQRSGYANFDRSAFLATKRAITLSTRRVVEASIISAGANAGKYVSKIA